MSVTNTTKNELCNELHIIEVMGRYCVNNLKGHNGKHIQKKYSHTSTNSFVMETI